mmetsp:Transcript_64751/g.151761  ORF Transcript_64751/g.151761 Transcript_64751/m.151761 type:complete len:224 (+) Transcript_64751:705-1376(+)
MRGEIFAGMRNDNPELCFPQHLDTFRNFALATRGNGRRHGAHIPLRPQVLFSFLLCQGSIRRQLLPLMVADGPKNLLALQHGINRQGRSPSCQPIPHSEGSQASGNDWRRNALLLAHTMDRAEQIFQLAVPASPKITTAARRGTNGISQNRDAFFHPGLLVVNATLFGNCNDFSHGRAPHLLKLRDLRDQVLGGTGSCSCLHRCRRADEGELFPTFGERILFQ